MFRGFCFVVFSDSEQGLGLLKFGYWHCFDLGFLGFGKKLGILENFAARSQLRVGVLEEMAEL